MFTITTERPQDGPAIEALLDRAFGPDRHQKKSYRYRVGIPAVPDLRLVARHTGDGRLIGTVRCWPVLIDDKPALLLGPLAVEPDLRGRGVGVGLMWEVLDMAAWAGHRVVVLVGDYAYYRRFGFTHAAPFGISMPDEDPARLLVLPLGRGTLEGISGTIRPWRSVRGGAHLRAA
ncbi:MAG TPA: N-acetyltransferase [Alphaproteobacteria bacterium]